jgi:hypothetical protein
VVLVENPELSRDSMVLESCLGLLKRQPCWNLVLTVVSPLHVKSRLCNRPEMYRIVPETVIVESDETRPSHMLDFWTT